MSTLDTALEYTKAGFSVIPLRLDGLKGPAIPTWTPYKSKIASKDECRTWFLFDEQAIGIVCGSISGGLEVIDFDMHHLLWPWFDGLPRDLQTRLVVVETPGGWHVLYRCIEICGNRKLAMWEEACGPSQRDIGHREGTGFESIGKGVRIETRGEGGYIVGEGSPCDVHSSGIPYVHYMGPPVKDVQYVSPDERRLMWQRAMTFDCSRHRESAALKRARQKVKEEIYGPIVSDGTEPWTWFDVHGDWFEILEPHGWSWTSYGWIRPGKEQGTSATLGNNANGEQILTVFSTSAGPLSPINGASHASFGKFNALALLEFDGNRAEAAKHVRAMMVQRRAA